MPIQLPLRLLARGRVVQRARVGEEATGRHGFLGRLTGNRQAEALADDGHDVLHRHALFGNGVVRRARFPLFEREAEQDGGVVAVDGGPARGAGPDVGDGAFFAEGRHHHRDQPFVAGAVDRGRQPHHHAPDPSLLREAVDQVRGQGARLHGRFPRRFRVLGRERALGQAERAGGDEERFVGSGEGVAHGFDGGAVRRARTVEVGEVVHEGEVDDCVAGLGAALQASEVREVAFVGGCARLGEAGGGGGAPGEAEDLVVVFEQFADGGLADEAGGSRDEDAHGWGVDCF